MKSPNDDAETPVVTHLDGLPVFTGQAAQGVHNKDSQVSYHPEEYYASFLSAKAKERRPAPIRGLYPLENLPNMISLLAGKPNPDTFPLTSFSFTARSPTDPSTEESYEVKGPALSEALQYSATSGLPSLVDWVTGLQEFSHGRKRGEGWRVSIGSGSQDVLYKAFHALIDDGDPVLVESPVYAGVIPIFQSLHSDLIGDRLLPDLIDKTLTTSAEIETDADGISSTSLREVLDTWPATKRKPRILYTVPYGCNPTGMTASLERRLEVLAIAREHNILIVEDDPYYYLYFGTRPRPLSFFALEVHDGGGPAGIVLRFDSFSKILSAGMRLGAVSGPEPLLRVIDMHTATANLQVSSLTQVVTYTLLSAWGYDGFRRHTEGVSALYREKRDVFESAMRKHLDGLADWVTPEAGMFFWFKLRLPPSEGASDGDSAALIRTKALENGVLALPGTSFFPSGKKSAYVRASFSLLGKEQVEEALRRLAEVIQKEHSV